MKMILKCGFILILTFLTWNFFKIKVIAAAPNIFINELIPNPSGDDAKYEWIELYNNSDLDINLDGWKIDNATISNTIINSYEYLVIAKNKSELTLLYPSVVNITQASISLLNSTETIELKDSTGNIVDSITYSSPLDGKSLERKGPLALEICKSLISHTTSSTIFAQNSAYDSACWPEIEAPTEEVEIIGIEFSTDNSNWYSSLELIGDQNVYLRYVLSDDAANATDIIWEDNLGNSITNPFIFKNYINKSITVEANINGESKTHESDQVTIYPEISITEFMPNSEATWVEIYNVNDYSVDLSGFYLKNISGSAFNLGNSACNNSLVLQPLSYYVIYLDQSFLNNTADEISLGIDTLIIDSVGYLESALNQSYSLLEGEWRLDLAVTPGGQNKELEIIFNPTLQISEIYPNLNSGEEEWIELYNYGEFDLDLSSYYFADNKLCNEVSTPKLLVDKNIDTLGYTVIYKSVSGISLNDSGDTLRLCKENIEIDVFKYNKTVKGSSISRIINEGKYVADYTDSDPDNYVSFFTIPTPDEENIVEQVGNGSPDITYTNIITAKSHTNGQIVHVTGYIIVQSNILFSKTAYIQDSTGGIRIYLGDLDINVPLNSLVKITGVLSEVSGERKINASEIIVDTSSMHIDPNNNLVDLEQQEGTLIYVEGEIVNNYSTSFDINTSLGLLRVSVLSQTGIEIAEKSKGDYVKIIGVLSQDGDKYRLLPRFQSDLTIINIEEVKAVTTKVKAATPKKSVLSSSAKTKSAAATTKKASSNSTDLPVYSLENNETDTTSKDQEFWPLYLTGLILLGFFTGYFNREKIILYAKFYANSKKDADSAELTPTANRFAEIVG